MPNDTVTKIITVLAVSGSAYLAGFTSSITVITVPILPLSGPFIATKQWSKLYGIGSQLGPPMGLASLAAFGYCAWAYGAQDLKARGLAFALAGLCAGANMPWTLIAMVPTNSALQSIADESPSASAEIDKDWKARQAREEEVRVLVGRWAWMNAVRSVGPTIGALLGGAAAVGLI